MRYSSIVNAVVVSRYIQVWLYSHPMSQCIVDCRFFIVETSRLPVDGRLVTRRVSPATGCWGPVGRLPGVIRTQFAAGNWVLRHFLSQLKILPMEYIQVTEFSHPVCATSLDFASH